MAMKLNGLCTIFYSSRAVLQHNECHVLFLHWGQMHLFRILYTMSRFSLLALVCVDFTTISECIQDMYILGVLQDFLSG